MKVVIVSDTWHPQGNDVVKTLTEVTRWLEKQGHQVIIIQPDQFKTVPCPTYPSVRLAIFPSRKVARQLRAIRPDAIHIATEGPLGIAARKYCLDYGLNFTSSYHTRLPEHISSQTGIPVKWLYRWVRNFHSRASNTLVATYPMRNRLLVEGFRSMKVWERGVDRRLFYPRNENLLNEERPVALFMGRVSAEKNIEDFLKLDIPVKKRVMGDGPDRVRLEKRYPEVHFVGFKQGEELARYLAASDVFVFPSKTDTFGISLIEALACGVPVAAYPVAGPVDIVKQNVTGVLDKNLGRAVMAALELNREDCSKSVSRYRWESCAQQFLDSLEPVRQPSRQKRREYAGAYSI